MSKERVNYYIERFKQAMDEHQLNEIYNAAWKDKNVTYDEIFFVNCKRLARFAELQEVDE